MSTLVKSGQAPKNVDINHSLQTPSQSQKLEQKNVIELTTSTDMNEYLPLPIIYLLKKIQVLIKL